MVEAEKLKGSKRFGARYGRRVKHKLDEIEVIQRGEHKCPYCSSMKAKRIASGIWECRKCKAKFTGKAYDVAKKIMIKEEITEKAEAEEDKRRKAREAKEVVEEEEEFDEEEANE